MVPNLNDLRAAEDHRQALLREAAQSQFIATTDTHRPRRRFYIGFLVRLGRLLVVWGARLQSLERVQVTERSHSEASL